MDTNFNSRRSFIKKAAVGAAAAISFPEILSASLPAGKIKPIKLLKDQVMLFQGDSITDSGRNKEDTGIQYCQKPWLRLSHACRSCSS